MERSPSMEETTSFADIIKILRRRLWIIFLVMIVAVGLAAFFSFVVLPPVYEAGTSLIVNERSSVPQDTSGIDYGQVQTSRSLAVTYAKIITSRAILQDTIDVLGLSESTKQLAKMTTVEVQGETEIIAISVKDKNATRAALIANTMAASFIRQLPTFMNRVENVSVIDRAVPVADQVSPRPVLNIAVALTAGLVLGVLLAFAIDYFDDTVKTAEDVKRLFGLRVLAVIPDGNLKGDLNDSYQRG